MPHIDRTSAWRPTHVVYNARGRADAILLSLTELNSHSASTNDQTCSAYSNLPSLVSNLIARHRYVEGGMSRLQGELAAELTTPHQFQREGEQLRISGNDESHLPWQHPWAPAARTHVDSPTSMVAERGLRVVTLRPLPDSTLHADLCEAETTMFLATRTRHWNALIDITRLVKAALPDAAAIVMRYEPHPNLETITPQLHRIYSQMMGIPLWEKNNSTPTALTDWRTDDHHQWDVVLNVIDTHLSTILDGAGDPRDHGWHELVSIGGSQFLHGLAHPDLLTGEWVLVPQFQAPGEAYGSCALRACDPCHGEGLVEDRQSGGTDTCACVRTF